MSTTEQQEQPITVPSINKLYVGNVEYSTTKEELEELFSEYQIESIDIPTRSPKFKNGKRGKPKSKGYVFVTFDASVEDLDSIIEKFTDFEFKDRKIYLSHPAPPKEESATEQKSEAASGENAPKSTTAKKSTPKLAAKKEKIPFEKGTKSTDTIYLKNLDFQTNAKELRSYFTEENEDVKWVSVPFKRLPGFVLKKLASKGKTIEKRNKGYAFVKFKLVEGETIDDKVTKFQGKDYKGRELQVSVAVDVRNVEEGEADDEGDDNEASA